MFKFEHPEYLYALLIIPIIIVLFVGVRYWRKRTIKAFGDPLLVQRLMPQWSRYKSTIKFILLTTSVLFLIIGWANPQWGTKREKVSQKSADVFIALDISQSMMAQDISPSRMERAKRFAQQLVETLKGERIGLVYFAGNAYMQMPLSTDYAAAQLFLKSANPDMAPSQGTAIAEAVDLAERSFEEDAEHHKALIIITDGENHDETALQRMEEAHDNGLLAFTVGVGTAEGSFIPTMVNNREDFKRDKTGNPVRSKLNEPMLRELAQAGGGAYFPLTGNSDAITNALQKGIDKLEKKEVEQRIFSEYESYFQYFIAAAILFLILEFLLSYRKSKWWKGKDLFGA